MFANNDASNDVMIGRTSPVGETDTRSATAYFFRKALPRIPRRFQRYFPDVLRAGHA